VLVSSFGKVLDEGKAETLAEGIFVAFPCRRLGRALAVATARGERLGEPLFQSLDS
jgi:hypothetical protein